MHDWLLFYCTEQFKQSGWKWFILCPWAVLTGVCCTVLLLLRCMKKWSMNDNIMFSFFHYDAVVLFDVLGDVWRALCWPSLSGPSVARLLWSTLKYLLNFGSVVCAFKRMISRLFTWRHQQVKLSTCPTLQFMRGHLWIWCSDGNRTCVVLCITLVF